MASTVAARGGVGEVRDEDLGRGGLPASSALVRRRCSYWRVESSFSALGLGCGSRAPRVQQQHRGRGPRAWVDGVVAIDGGPGDARPGDARPAPPTASLARRAPVEAGAGVTFCDATYGGLRVAFEGSPTPATQTSRLQVHRRHLRGPSHRLRDAVSSAIAKGRITFDPTAAGWQCVTAFQQRVEPGQLLGGWTGPARAAPSSERARVRAWSRGLQPRGNRARSTSNARAD